MTSTQPIFSIIIPTFNRAVLLVRSVKSILSQQNVSLEVIVVDDGSQDDTSERVKELNDQRLRYIRIHNSERGAARNAGLLISTGSYINYFDSDDIFNPILDQLYSFLVTNRLPDVAFGKIENTDEEGASLNVVEQQFSNFKKSILYNNFLACGSVFIKREIALQYLFSEDRKLSGTEDWELWLRLYSAYDFVEFPQIIFKQVHHPSRSLIKASLERITEREITFAKHIIKNQNKLLNRFSKREISLLIADRYTLIGLAQAECGSKKVVAEYLLKSLDMSVFVVVRRRFWAVLRKLIIGR